MNIILGPLFLVLTMAIGLYIKAIIIWVILSWLTVFGIVNKHNRYVYLIDNFLNKITEPFLYKIRRFLPPINGLDLSPMILIFGAIFIERVLYNLYITFS